MIVFCTAVIIINKIRCNSCIHDLSTVSYARNYLKKTSSNKLRPKNIFGRVCITPNNQPHHADFTAQQLRELANCHSSLGYVYYLIGDHKNSVKNIAHKNWRFYLRQLNRMHCLTIMQVSAHHKESFFLIKQRA
jgi:hypothetical protein